MSWQPPNNTGPVEIASLDRTKRIPRINARTRRDLAHSRPQGQRHQQVVSVAISLRGAGRSLAAVEAELADLQPDIPP